jgi:hypothetical protein
MLCGKIIEEELANTNPYDDDDDDMPKKSLSVCLRCKAKLKHEADESQKIPKPM